VVDDHGTAFRGSFAGHRADPIEAVASMTIPPAPDPAATGGLLACVVLAHTDPVHLHRLVRALDPFPVYLHVDIRTPPDIHRAMVSGLPDYCRLLPRIATGWARWENVAAEIAGYRAALAEQPLTHVALLTGTDYPLASTESIRELLGRHPTSTFAEVNPLPYAQWGRSGGMARLRYPHWAHQKRMIRVPIPRRLPAGIRFAGGSQLKILASRHAQAVVDTTDGRPDLVRFWARSWIADETYIPSLLNSPNVVPDLAQHLVPMMPWWIGWDGAARKSPPWLSLRDYDAIRSRRLLDSDPEPRLFARKFSTDLSTELLDAIDATMREPGGQLG